MELIDTHCHLDFPVFDADREALLTRWRQLGVGEYIIPAVGEENWGRVVALAERTTTSAMAWGSDRKSVV